MQDTILSGWGGDPGTLLMQGIGTLEESHPQINILVLQVIMVVPET